MSHATLQKASREKDVRKWTVIFHALSALIDQRHEVKSFKLCRIRRGLTYCVLIGYLNGEVALILNVQDYSSFPRKNNLSDLKMSLYISSRDGWKFYLSTRKGIILVTYIEELSKNTE